MRTTYFLNIWKISLEYIPIIIKLFWQQYTFQVHWKWWNWTHFFQCRHLRTYFFLAVRVEWECSCVESNQNKLSSQMFVKRLNHFGTKNSNWKHRKTIILNWFKLKFNKICRRSGSSYSFIYHFRYHCSSLFSIRPKWWLMKNSTWGKVDIIVWATSTL